MESAIMRVTNTVGLSVVAMVVQGRSFHRMSRLGLYYFHLRDRMLSRVACTRMGENGLGITSTHAIVKAYLSSVAYSANWLVDGIMWSPLPLSSFGVPSPSKSRRRPSSFSRPCRCGGKWT